MSSHWNHIRSQTSICIRGVWHLHMRTYGSDALPYGSDEDLKTSDAGEVTQALFGPWRWSSVKENISWRLPTHPGRSWNVLLSESLFVFNALWDPQKHFTHLYTRFKIRHMWRLSWPGTEAGTKSCLKAVPSFNESIRLSGSCHAAMHAIPCTGRASMCFPLPPMAATKSTKSFDLPWFEDIWSVIATYSNMLQALLGTPRHS